MSLKRGCPVSEKSCSYPGNIRMFDYIFLMNDIKDKTEFMEWLDSRINARVLDQDQELRKSFIYTRDSVNAYVNKLKQELADHAIKN